MKKLIYLFIAFVVVSSCSKEDELVQEFFDFENSIYDSINTSSSGRIFIRSQTTLGDLEKEKQKISAIFFNNNGVREDRGVVVVNNVELVSNPDDLYQYKPLNGVSNISNLFGKKIEIHLPNALTSNKKNAGIRSVDGPKLHFYLPEKIFLSNHFHSSRGLKSISRNKDLSVQWNKDVENSDLVLITISWDWSYS